MRSPGAWQFRLGKKPGSGFRVPMRPLFWLGWLISLFLGAAPGWTQEPPIPLRSVAALRQLPMEELKKSLPVVLQGVVTLSSPEYSTLFIHDGTHGIFVGRGYLPGGSGPAAGDLVEITGVTDTGHFAPVVLGKDGAPPLLKVLGRPGLPIPKPVTGKEMMEPALDCDYVAIEADFRKIFLTERELYFECQAGPCRFMIVANEPVGLERIPWHLEGRRVRVPGIVATNYNSSRQMVSRLLRINQLQDISPLPPVPQEAGPARPALVKELLTLEGPGEHDLVRIQGQTTLAIPGKGFYLRTEAGSLWVQDPRAPTSARGDLMEVIGWPEAGRLKPSLRARQTTRLNSGPTPDPRRVSADEILNSGAEAELVTLEVELLDQVQTRDELRLDLRQDSVIFRGILPLEPGVKRQFWDTGSRLDITGLVSLAPGPLSVPYQQGQQLQILMRSPADIRLVRRPPWWTPGRVFAAAGLLFLAMLGGFGYARSRRKAAQAAQRREFEAVLAERSRCAREIHDTLAQGLTSISLRLECAREDVPLKPDRAMGHLEEARTLVRSSLREARRAVWNLRLEAPDGAGLMSSLQRVASSFWPDGRMHCDFETEGPIRPLAPREEEALLRIGQEALTNIARHASATRTTITLSYESDVVTLRVQDNGRGFSLDDSPAKSFGLTGMAERMAVLGGSLSIDSQPGQGTLVSATLAT
jgi:signal transduction histidine kinase